ncbi:MAG: Gfo/Idh/MocA family oxidoreductase [Candidatus Hydrogenedentes bacterium]|nr:Gfo/Idh/MocA family oxidoreductase [Candidatus Hydrogenedentota bacterium]
MSKQPKTHKTSKSRRNFIKTAAAVAGATAATAQSANAGVYKSILPSTILGANEKIRTGHIGVGGMGTANLIFAMRRNDMEPIALCDLYPEHLNRAHGIAKKKPGLDPSRHHDFRDIIDNKDVDAVVIATPDHWHCLPTLYAAVAGKAIYCEKPAATTIKEGQAMVDAVRQNNVVFQAGNMQRSGKHFQEAVQMIRSGYIGKVHRVETWIHDKDGIAGIGMGESGVGKYEGLDWDLYQGWTEHVPINSNRMIYNFRWFLDYSGGKITDWGAHLLDIALWAMEDEDVTPNLQPKSVVTNGGKWVLQDNRTTPDTMDVLFEFDDFTLSFENRVWNGHVPEDADRHGILFHGTLGSLQVSRGGYQVWATDNNAEKGKRTLEEIKVAPYEELNPPHWENFANCVRSGENPISTVEVIHNTTRLCHLGTCSYVAGGAKLGWDADKQKFTGADRKAVKAANKHAYRKYNNGWSLKAPYYRG